jgi:hypothetical protein
MQGNFDAAVHEFISSVHMGFVCYTPSLVQLENLISGSHQSAVDVGPNSTKKFVP